MKMRRLWLIVVMLPFLTASAADSSAAPGHLSNRRPIQVSHPDVQNYVVVDDSVWTHAQADLADLRLYDARGTEVPYALQVQGEISSTRKLSARLFNLAMGAQGTQFLLEISPEAGSPRQYDRVQLNLDAKDFVGNARMEGTDDVSSGPWAVVGTFSIFDFTSEKLGRNVVLNLPESSYRYLRIVLHAPLKPENVKGATVANHETQRAAWVTIGSTPRIGEEGHTRLVPGEGIGRLANDFPKNTTSIMWLEPASAPLERIVFEVAGTANFLRSVTVERIGSQGVPEFVIAGEISRVHMKRGGETIDSSRLEIPIPSAHGDHFLVSISNGDDPPLPITRVLPQSLERRVYFDPLGKTDLQLYYGGDKVSPPIYDYAKLFQLQQGVIQAGLGADEHNPAFTGYLDLRPWTDRHPWVMWTALAIAVLGLGTVALRSLTKG